MTEQQNRRQFLKTTGTALAATGLAASGLLRSASAAAPPIAGGEHAGRIYKSIKFGMFREKISYEEKFQLLKDMGYDGVELNSPGAENKPKALEASRATGLPLHGVVDSIHWRTRLSDPKPEVRAEALKGLMTAIREAHYIGGTAVLLVPGSVTNAATENQEQVWERSIAGIRKALPLAAQLGIHVLIENVWNRFCYDHDGPNNQTADRLAKYIDEINSPWIGCYFDIGNHQKYGKPADWIRTLGRRIVKIDVKDWSRERGFGSAIGEGDVDWADVRKALGEIGFTGWATAEVRGGDRGRIKEVAERMDRVLGLV